MLSLTDLVRSVEPLLPPESALLHLLRHNHDTASLLFALAYAEAGEPEEILAPSFVLLLEQAALKYTALVAQPC